MMSDLAMIPSRRAVLKGAGALTVSFALAPYLIGDGLAQEARLPASFKSSPRLDSWIRINADGTVTVFTGKVELGQGLKTALTQMAAEELDLPIARFRVVTGDTEVTPNEGGTVGSQSIEQSGAAVRQAAADVRVILFELAAAKLNAPVDQLQVEDGKITARGGNSAVTYWQLVDGQTLRRNADGRGKPKTAKDHKLVGTPVPRVDLPAKVTGGAAFVQDLRLPGMLHGRVVRPPSYSAKLDSVNVAAAKAMPGIVQVVRDGSFLAVIAEREEQAIRAADRLRDSAKWQEPDSLPKDSIYDVLTNAKTTDALIVNGSPSKDAVPAMIAPEGGRVVSATYHKPYFMHGAVGPSAAVAQMEGDKMTVWTHSQTIFNLRDVVGQVLRIKPEQVRCIHMEGAGCYGHNGADDAGLDAALLAKAVPGQPVRVQWSREDEHKWEPYGAAMVVKTQASLDANGSVVAWNSDIYTNSHGTRPRGKGTTTEMSAGWFLAEPFPRSEAEPSNGRHSGEYRNSDPLYTFPARRVVSHFVAEMPLRVSSTRGLGAWGNVFAIESFMDELAVAAKADPVAFRLKHLKDERAQAVIKLAAEKAGWKPGPAVRGDGKGRGFAFAQYKNIMGYTAIVVDVDVDRASGKISLKRAWIAGDSGQIINPDGLINQLEGGFIQSASWTLKEAVDYDSKHITSSDWSSYPILTFAEVPEIETFLIPRQESQPLGSGEVTQGPTSAAIANAVYNAIGIRLREAPFTPERVKAAMVG